MHTSDNWIYFENTFLLFQWLSQYKRKLREETKNKSKEFYQIKFHKIRIFLWIPIFIFIVFPFLKYFLLKKIYLLFSLFGIKCLNT